MEGRASLLTCPKDGRRESVNYINSFISLILCMGVERELGLVILLIVSSQY